MKVCHLSTVHTIRDIRIFEKECRSLAAAGYDVTFIARGEADAEVDGVHIRVLPPVKGRLRRMFLMPLKAFSMARRSGAKLVHFHDPELMPIGLLLKLVGRKVVYDSHENLKQDILHSKDYIPKSFRRPLSILIGCLEKLLVGCFDAVVCASGGIAERFPANKAVTVWNYPILPEAPLQGTPYQNRQNIAFSAGGFTRTRAAAETVEAAVHLADVPGFKLVVAGPCRSSELLSELKGSAGWTLTDFRGQIARGEIETLLATAKVGILLNYFREDYQDISSNKLYEYMLAGIPVVAANIPSWQRTIEEIQCGVVVDPKDPADIARGIRVLLESPAESETMGLRGREAVLSRFMWSSEAKKLTELYGRLLQA